MHRKATALQLCRFVGTPNTQASMLDMTRRMPVRCALLRFDLKRHFVVICDCPVQAGGQAGPWQMTPPLLFPCDPCPSSIPRELSHRTSEHHVSFGRTVDLRSCIVRIPYTTMGCETWSMVVPSKSCYR
jgi:hypothetical protein